MVLGIRSRITTFLTFLWRAASFSPPGNNGGVAWAGILERVFGQRDWSWSWQLVPEFGLRTRVKPEKQPIILQSTFL